LKKEKEAGGSIMDTAKDIKDNFAVLRNYSCEGQISILDLYRKDGEPRAAYKKKLLKRKQNILKMVRSDET
jgi:hypothetical protein